MLKQKTENRKQLRDGLCSFEYEVFHKPGKENEATDALSRNSPSIDSVEGNSKNDFKLKQEQDEELDPIFKFFWEGIDPKGKNAFKVAANFTLDEQGLYEEQNAKELSRRQSFWPHGCE